MTIRRYGGLVTVLTVAAIGASVSVSWGASRISRPGTVGLFAGGDYGILTGGSRYGLDYEAGGGYSINIRYVVHPNWSLGLNFISQNYDGVPEARPVEADKLVVTGFMGDIYYYRNREVDAAQYAVFGLGFFRPEIHLDTDEIIFPTESLLLSAGIGVEVFIRENWGLDLSARALGYFGDGVSNLEANSGTITPDGNFSAGLHGQVGIVYYLLR